MRRVPAPAAVAIVAAMVAALGASPALALTPPSVDGSALVRSAPVAPPEPTRQRAYCSEPILSERSVRTEPSAAQAMLNLPRAWEFSRGAGQRVAVIDTGVHPHPRLGAVRAGGDYVSSGTGLSDCDGHGTQVAGIIAARPAPGDAFAGVAPAASLISIRQSSGAFEPEDRRASDRSGHSVGPGYGSVATLAHAVVRAVDLDATVINISQVACAPAGTDLDDDALGAAVKYAYDNDVVVVAAAGNTSPQSSTCAPQNPTPEAADVNGWGSVTTVASPAWFTPYVLTVGAVDAGTGAPSPFSLHGPWVSVAAPGTGIVSLDSAPGSSGLVDAHRGDDGPVPLAGTSFAAPYVAGTAALVRSRFPDLDAGEVIERITRTAHAPGTGWDTRTGHGVIDPVAALTNLLPEEEPAAAVSAPIAAPSTEPPADHTARTVAVVGTLLCLAVTVAVLGVALPHRRVTRLDPDDL